MKIGLDELNEKIEIKTEYINTLPRNNKKNIEFFLKEVGKIHKEFLNYQDNILKEMSRRIKKLENLNSVNTSKMEEELNNIEGVMYLLNDIETPFEKMGLDKAIHNLTYYYKKNLEIVNEAIVYCINKFEEVGIKLKLEDFNYSKYVKEYLSLFFEKNEGINSKIVKTRFEEIYWKCSNIIIHIELNVRYIYLKYQKDIEKYYNKQKENLVKKFTKQDILHKYNETKKALLQQVNQDKNIIINKFITGELEIKNYYEEIIKSSYSKLIPHYSIEKISEKQLDDIDQNIEKLKNSLYEYKKYLEFKQIIDDIKSIYLEKDKYKNSYDQTRKQISAKEKKLMSLNSRVNRFFKKSHSKFINEQNNIILEIKELYKLLDKNKIYTKIATKLNDNSTITDVLYLASSFYNYLFYCMKKNNKEITEEEIEENFEEIRNFVKWPYSTIINNITILETKDIMLIIKDRYQLLNINIEKEDLQFENLDNLIHLVENISISHSIRKNKINLEEIEKICEFKKILKQ